MRYCTSGEALSLFQPDLERPGELFLDLKSFISDFKHGLDFIEDTSSQIVPRTVLDVIEVTRALGLRYLWVDAICIM